MARLCRVAFLLLATPVASADAIDDLMREEMQARHLPGASLAIVVGGEVRALRSYGVANLELQSAVTADSMFAIGSITKPFTAIAVMLLVDEGRVDLGGTIGDMLPQVPATWRNVRVAQLLAHTSGIADFVDNPCAHASTQPHTTADALAEAACEPLAFAPGERFEYSNTNYLLLGLLVERASGESLGAFLDKRIFPAFGMTRTRMADIAAIIPGRVGGYVWTERGHVNVAPFEPTGEFASGGLLSSARDMAQFLVALRARPLLSRGRWDAMWRPAPVRDGRMPYGLGFGLTPFDRQTRVGHNGAAPGFASSFSWFPALDVGVVILANGYEEAHGRNLGALANRIAVLYTQPLDKDRESGTKESD